MVSPTVLPMIESFPALPKAVSFAVVALNWMVSLPSPP